MLEYRATLELGKPRRTARNKLNPSRTPARNLLASILKARWTLSSLILEKCSEMFPRICNRFGIFLALRSLRVFYT